MNQQYEECSFEEATHARLAGGKVVNIERLEDTGNLYLGYIPIYRFPLTTEDFQDLGITPLRKVEVKPIEFEATFYESGPFWYPIYTFDDGAGTDKMKTAKFKCVQILEDEE